MNENLDLTKILKGCPRGTSLYSSIFGEVKLYGVALDYDSPIITDFTVEGKRLIAKFTSEGKYGIDYDGETVLFPAKDQRDWSKFERFWDKLKVERFDPKTLQPFDMVLVRDEDGDWRASFFSHINERGISTCGFIGSYAIPYNDDTKHLVGTSDDCPEYYKWWED